MILSPKKGTVHNFSLFFQSLIFGNFFQIVFFFFFRIFFSRPRKEKRSFFNFFWSPQEETSARRNVRSIPQNEHYSAKKNKKLPSFRFIFLGNKSPTKPKKNVFPGISCSLGSHISSRDDRFGHISNRPPHLSSQISHQRLTSTISTVAPKNANCIFFQPT